MHDHAVLDIDLTLFSEKALLFSNAAATLRLISISRRKQFELLQIIFHKLNLPN